MMHQYRPRHRQRDVSARFQQPQDKRWAVLRAHLRRIRQLAQESLVLLCYVPCRRPAPDASMYCAAPGASTPSFVLAQATGDFSNRDFPGIEMSLRGYRDPRTGQAASETARKACFPSFLCCHSQISVPPSLVRPLGPRCQTAISLLGRMWLRPLRRCVDGPSIVESPPAERPDVALRRGCLNATSATRRVAAGRRPWDCSVDVHMPLVRICYSSSLCWLTQTPKLSLSSPATVRLPYV